MVEFEDKALGKVWFKLPWTYDSTTKKQSVAGGYSVITKVLLKDNTQYIAVNIKRRAGNKFLPFLSFTITEKELACMMNPKLKGDKRKDAENIPENEIYA